MTLIKRVIRKEGLKDYEDMDFAEQRYLHTRIELEKLIAYMKQRDTKFNIKQMRDDYDQILSLMTGKKK